MEIAMALYIIMYHIARLRVTSPTRHCCCCGSLADQTHRFDHWRSFDQLLLEVIRSTTIPELPPIAAKLMSSALTNTVHSLYSPLPTVLSSLGPFSNGTVHRYIFQAYGVR